MSKTKRLVKASRTLLTPGRFELIVPDKVKIGVKEFTLNRDASRMFTFGGPLAAVSKTLGPFNGAVREDATGALIATLKDVRVTVTRMTGQQGQSFLLYALEYFVTSHGFRTGEGAGTDPSSADQIVYFQNSAGGTMTAWKVVFGFVLHCNDNGKFQLYQHTQTQHLGWFDDWAIYTQRIHGLFFRC